MLYPGAISIYLRQFVESLTPTQATVFANYLDGLTPKQIAGLLRMSPATIYRIVAELRESFRSFAARLGLGDE